MPRAAIAGVALLLLSGVGVLAWQLGAADDAPSQLGAVPPSPAPLPAAGAASTDPERPPAATPSGAQARHDAKPAPEGPGQIVVVVRDAASGGPFSAARVELHRGDRTTVRRWRSKDLVEAAATDSEGRATLHADPPFEGWVTVRPNAGSNLFLTRDVQLTATQRRVAIEIDLDTRGTVTFQGRVVNEHGEAIPGLEVTATWKYVDDQVALGGSSSGVGWGTGLPTTTDAEGRFAFRQFSLRPVWPGSGVTLVASVNRRPVAWARPELPDGGGVVDVEIVVPTPPPPIAVLPVAVTDEDGNAVPEARVVVRVVKRVRNRSGSRNGEATTGPDGRARVPLPQLGQLQRIEVTAPGHVPADEWIRETVTVREGESLATQHVTLERSVPTRFTLRPEPAPPGEIEWTAVAEPLGKSGEPRRGYRGRMRAQGVGSTAEIGLDRAQRYLVTIYVSGYEPVEIDAVSAGPSERPPVVMRPAVEPDPPPPVARVRVLGGTHDDLAWAVLAVAERRGNNGTRLGSVRSGFLDGRVTDVEPFDDEADLHEYWIVLLVPGFRRVEQRLPVPPPENRPVEVVLRLEPR